jgi:putative SOS response-associated peptidase YedK
MCDLYSQTRAQDAVRRLFGVINDRAGNLPSLPAILPDQLAPIIRIGKNNQRTLELMRWGLPPLNRGTRPVTNVRKTRSPYWHAWLEPEFRCLVPATSFCEYSDSQPKVPYWFALAPDRPQFAFAGIWRSWTGERKKETRDHFLFSFLTTEANGVVRPIHAEEMPVVLTTPAEFDAWLSADVEGALKLQRPLPGDRLRIVARGGERDGAG